MTLLDTCFIIEFVMLGENLGVNWMSGVGVAISTTCPLGGATLAQMLIPDAAQNPNPPSPSDAVDWTVLAQVDLEATYAITLENHPGVYNNLDPDFIDMAIAALEKASGLAPRCKMRLAMSTHWNHLRY